MRPRTRLSVLAATTVLAATALTTPTATATPAAPDPGVPFTTTLHQAVGRLPVADESREGYQRTSFKHWTDSDRDGCNARKEVLIEEAVEAPEIGAKCTLIGGSWYSAYDDRTINSATALDVDHMVPLAEAWDSK